MQEPPWHAVVAYIATILRRSDWSSMHWLALVRVVALAGFAGSWVWARHREKQQFGTLRSVIDRGVEGLGQPFWMLSTSSQSPGFERLRDILVGNRDMVRATIVGLGVRLEAVPVDDLVLEALDRLAAQWQDKLSSARTRRYRRLRELEKQGAVRTERDRDVGARAHPDFRHCLRRRIEAGSLGSAALATGRRPVMRRLHG